MDINKYDLLHNKLETLADDFLKFYEKKNKAAGTRVRKGMQELKEMCQEIRKDVQEKKLKIE